MRYRVEFVTDQALPTEIDWTFATTVDYGVVLFMKASRLSPAALTDAWNAWERHRARRLVSA